MLSVRSAAIYSTVSEDIVGFGGESEAHITGEWIYNL